MIKKQKHALSIRVPGSQKLHMTGWQLIPVWHRMLYSCTHMATVGVKGLNAIRQRSHSPQCCDWLVFCLLQWHLTITSTSTMLREHTLAELGLQ